MKVKKEDDSNCFCQYKMLFKHFFLDYVMKIPCPSIAESQLEKLFLGYMALTEKRTNMWRKAKRSYCSNSNFNGYLNVFYFTSFIVYNISLYFSRVPVIYMHIFGRFWHLKYPDSLMIQRCDFKFTYNHPKKVYITTIITFCIHSQTKISGFFSKTAMMTFFCLSTFTYIFTL